MISCRLDVHINRNVNINGRNVAGKATADQNFRRGRLSWKYKKHMLRVVKVRVHEGE